MEDRDSRISFIEDTHTYLIDGKHVPGLLSVTTFVHAFFEHFDADTVLAKMRRSAGWANSKYFGRTNDEIKAEWDRVRDEAADAGTKLHLAIEQYYNAQIARNAQIDGANEIEYKQDPDVIKTVEYGYFEQFVRDHPHLKPFKTEWRIFDEDLKIAGSVDMVFYDPDDQTKIYIYDWKRSKEIKRSNRYQKGTYPLGHMDDCNYNHYTLQLNVYRYILEKNYGVETTQLAIVVFHPNNDTYDKIVLPMLDDVMDVLVEHRRKWLL